MDIVEKHVLALARHLGQPVSAANRTMQQIIVSSAQRVFVGGNRGTVAGVGKTDIDPVERPRMGLLDRLRIEDGLDITLPGFEDDPTAVTWQTKSLYPPAMENYKLTIGGRLYREETRVEEVSMAERPYYDEAIGGFEREFERARGMLRTIHEGWTDTAYHGTIEFHRSIDDKWYAYETTFTHGDLGLVQRVDRWSLTR